MNPTGSSEGMSASNEYFSDGTASNDRSIADVFRTTTAYGHA